MSEWSSSTMSFPDMFSVFDCPFIVSESDFVDEPVANDTHNVHPSQQPISTTVSSNTKTFMWDYVFSPEDIQNGTYKNYFTEATLPTYKSYSHHTCSSTRTELPRQTFPVELGQAYDCVDTTIDPAELQNVPPFNAWNAIAECNSSQELLYTNTNNYVPTNSHEDASYISEPTVTQDFAFDTSQVTDQTVALTNEITTLHENVMNNSVMCDYENGFYPEEKMQPPLQLSTAPVCTTFSENANSGVTLDFNSDSVPQFTSSYDEFVRTYSSGMAGPQMPSLEPSPQGVFPRRNVNSKPVVCSLCNAVFCSKYYLNKHINDHPSRGCSQCLKCSTSKPIRTETEELGKGKHEFEAVNASSDCGETFQIQEEPQNHEFSKQNQRPFKCTVRQCTFAATSSKGLYNHKKTKHIYELGVTQLVCSFCGRIFGLKFCLKRHIVTYHKPDRPFRCTAVGCKKSFKLKQHLVQHLKVHK